MYVNNLLIFIKIRMKMVVILKKIEYFCGINSMMLTCYPSDKYS